MTNRRSSNPSRELSSGIDELSITTQDDELLNHFLGEATEQLAGFSYSLKEFCQSLAPQLGHHYPAVRYALLSVAARTRSAVFRWDLRRSRAAAMSYKAQSLVYYNAAIQHLTPSPLTSEVPAEVYLVCGLLFAGTEFWPHRHMAPTIHILTAFRLILRGTSMLPEAVKEGMFPFLVHMGRKTLAFADNIPGDCASQIRIFVWLTVPPPPVPSIFSSLNEAWSYMDNLLNYVGAFSYDDLNFTMQARSHALCYASGLRNALLETTSLLHSDDHHHHMQYRALRMHHRTIQVMLDAAIVRPGDESIYDLFTADFEHILYECEQLLQEEQSQRISSQQIYNQPSSSPHSPIPSQEQQPSPPPSSSPKSQPWHTTLGLLAPLFFVATRCRIPTIRHRAIKTLHASRRREREWNSCIATMLARFVVRTEHEYMLAGAAGVGVSGIVYGSAVRNDTVPAEHRICLQSVCFQREKGLVRVEYVRPRTRERGVGTLSWEVERAGGIDDDFECVMVSRRGLRMSGYAGIMLVTPSVECQCGREEEVPDG